MNEQERKNREMIGVAEGNLGRPSTQCVEAFGWKYNWTEDTVLMILSIVFSDKGADITCLSEDGDQQLLALENDGDDTEQDDPRDVTAVIFRPVA